MGYLRFFALLAVVGMACDSRAQGTKEVWLDELDLSCCIQDWGLPQADRSVLDTPLTVGGVVYGRGVGTHSISRMLFGLGGDAVSIAGAVGADDKNLFAGKHRFTFELHVDLLGQFPGRYHDDCTDVIVGVTLCD